MELVWTKNLIFGQKKWAKARFYKPKVGRKNRMHFLKTALFWRFLAIFGRFAQIACLKTTKKPTCPLLFLIIAIKSFNIYINKAYKSGHLTTNRKHIAQIEQKVKRFLKNVLYLFWLLCYTVIATQSNIFKLQGKIALVKSVFSLYSCVLCDLIEIVWQQ